ncbi:TIGR00266 family protein [Paenibacillus sp. J22TS3]|uniref:TIGR00266 family protein n=1 Tax=Paenibacillus sp. J22TS3 TaxID=2807192 RepID=UPI001B09FB69|nr:TIGR00266 family protein [Paenibacillus sp. J22TS3]GIP21671.1 TIGR00266 family protein [Paenibacillus sp. J22TS3]
MSAHEIDYRIIGEEMQCVEIQLDPSESVVAEAGSFMMMDQDIQMETIFGDGSRGNGMMGKLMGAGKRLLTGESLFMTVFTNEGRYRQNVTFASPYPGKIIPLDLQLLGGKIICQKDSFLCSAKGNSIGIEFQRKLGAGFFGGEGFIMQKIEGDGWAFVHSGGLVIERTLNPGEVLRLDTGCLVAMTAGIDYDIEFVKGVKSALFGGEGLFFATLRGPGKVWVQSLPFSRMADRVLSAATFGRKDEGSILGGLGNLFER